MAALLKSIYVFAEAQLGHVSIMAATQSWPRIPVPHTLKDSFFSFIPNLCLWYHRYVLSLIPNHSVPVSQARSSPFSTSFVVCYRPQIVFCWCGAGLALMTVECVWFRGGGPAIWLPHPWHLSSTSKAPSQTMTKWLWPSTEKHTAHVQNHNTCQPLHYSQDNWNNKLPSESLCLQSCLVYRESHPGEKTWKENPQVILFKERKSGNLDE